jgi:hypothetical protein
MGFDVGKDEVLQDFCNPWQEALQPPASKKSKVGYRTVRCKRLRVVPLFPLKKKNLLTDAPPLGVRWRGNIFF